MVLGETIHREDSHLRMHNGHLRDSQGEKPHLWQSFVKPLEKVLGAVQKIKCFGNYELAKLSFVSSWDWKHHILLQSSTEETSASRNLAQN